MIPKDTIKVTEAVMKNNLSQHKYISLPTMKQCPSHVLVPLTKRPFVKNTFFKVEYLQLSLDNLLK